jgi:hypothetical protein
MNGHLLGPVALVLRADSELITDPLASPFVPAGNGGSSPRRPQGRWGYTVSTADSANFRPGYYWLASPG